MTVKALNGVPTFDKYGEEDFLGLLLRCGLFLGAIFQLLCISSSILLPIANEGSSTEDCNEDYRFNNDSGLKRMHKLRKQEKKKRR